MWTTTGAGSCTTTRTPTGTLQPLPPKQAFFTLASGREREPEFRDLLNRQHEGRQAGDLYEVEVLLLLAESLLEFYFILFA